MRAYTVKQDYSVPRLNGKDGVVWAEGSTVVLHDDDADWVNRDRAGTLKQIDEVTGDGAGEALPPVADGEYPADAVDVPTGGEPEQATRPAAEQVGGKPRGRGRRRDSAG